MVVSALNGNPGAHVAAASAFRKVLGKPVTAMKENSRSVVLSASLAGILGRFK